MSLLGCTLEEAWGDTRSFKRKTKKEKRLERDEKKMLKDAVDPNILVPEMANNNTYNLADYRKGALDQHITASDPGEGNFAPYKVGKYPPHKSDNIPQHRADGYIPNHDNGIIDTVKNAVSTVATDIVQITREEYDKMKELITHTNSGVEGFENQTDEQFNQLILYIFTGIFYLLMLDMMYQLGKKSY